MMYSVEGFILVGGASSRMGTDKSRLTVDGLTFTEKIAGALAQITQSVKVVGKSAVDLGLESTSDIFEQWGALGGLHAALAACRMEWSLIVACDLPFVTAKLFTRLAGLRPGFEAVVPVQQNGYVQPLCALYRVDPCLERCETLIKAGDRRPLALLEAVKSRRVEFAEISDLADADRFFDNINTPEDYVRATMKGDNLSAKG
jgi:molybdopterin-guanine dinucleotide biosynthesis protein A